MPTFDRLAKHGIRYKQLETTQPAAEEQGDVSRGFDKAMLQIPQTAGGAAALVGDLIGSDGLREYGMGVYQKNSDKIEAITKPSDSLTTVLEGDGDAVDWVQQAAGYTGGQALSALATGGLGGFIGKKLAQRGIKEVIERGAKSAAAKQVANKVAQRGATVGAVGALAGNNLVQEAGAIYPEAVHTAEEEGRELDAGDKARVVGSAIAAAAVDTGMDALLAGRVLAGGRRAMRGTDGAVMRDAAGAPVHEGLGRALLREAPGMAAKEAVTEGIQTGIERYGAGQQLNTADSIRDYVDSMGLGAVGGGMGGAVSALNKQKVPEMGALSRAANTGIDQQILQLQYDPQPLISFPDGSVGTKAEMEMYLLQFDGEERTRKRRELMGRDPETGKRVQPEEPKEAPYVSDEDKEAQNLKAWGARHDGVPLDYAQSLIAAPGAKGLGLMIVPHPKGKDFTVVPSKWLTLDSQARFAALQKGDAGMLPAPGDSRQDITNPRPDMMDYQVAPSSDTPDGMMNHNINRTPIRVGADGTAARETVKERQDTDREARDQAKADQLLDARERELGKSHPHGPRQARAAGEIPTLTETIYNPKGEPFKSEFSARRRLEADQLDDSHAVAEVFGGWVLEPKGATNGAAVPTNPGTTGEQGNAAAAAAGTSERAGSAAAGSAPAAAPAAAAAPGKPAAAGAVHPAGRTDPNASLTHDDGIPVLTDMIGHPRDIPTLTDRIGKPDEIPTLTDEIGHADDIPTLTDIINPDQPAAEGKQLEFRGVHYRQAGDGWELSRDRKTWGKIRSRPAIDALERGQDPNPTGATVTPPADRGADREPTKVEVQRDQIDQAAHEAATSPNNELTEPTQAQKEAGNYKKGHTKVHGLDITIENPAGSVRRGVSRDGKEWENTLAHHYGYIRRTTGADGDHVDTFIGPKPDSSRVFIVNQIDPDTGRFDEHKVILGAESLEEARGIYEANYEKGWQGGKDIVETSAEGFKAWLIAGDTTKPVKAPKRTEQYQATQEQNQRQADVVADAVAANERHRAAPPAEPTYEQAKARADAARERSKAAGQAMDKFPRGPMNLTPDSVKATPEWQKARKEVDDALAEERAANTVISQRFAKESRADRDKQRAEKLAAQQAAEPKAEAPAPAPVSNPIERLQAMEQDAGQGFKTNDQAMTVIRQAAKQMSPEAKAKVSRAIKQETAVEPDGTRLIKPGFYDAIADAFAYVGGMLTQAMADIEAMARPVAGQQKVHDYNPDDAKPLLLIACSDKKLEGKHPAGQLYQGALFEMLNKWMPADASKRPHVYIISAKYGAIPADKVIASYNQEMTDERQEVLLKQGVDLADFAGKNFSSVFIAAGQDYRTVADAYVAQLQKAGHVAPDAEVKSAKGMIGQLRSQVGQYLRDLAARQFKAGDVLVRMDPYGAETDELRLLDDIDYSKSQNDLKPGESITVRANYTEHRKKVRGRWVRNVGTGKFDIFMLQKEYTLKSDLTARQAEEAAAARAAAEAQQNDGYQGEEIETEAAPDPAADPFHGFLDGLAPMLAKRASNALEQNVRFNGEVRRRKDEVERRVKDGATIVDKPIDGRRLTMPGGTFMTEKDISKTAMDYAAHLIALRDAPAPAAAAPAPAAEPKRQGAKPVQIEVSRDELERRMLPGMFKTRKETSGKDPLVRGTETAGTPAESEIWEANKTWGGMRGTVLGQVHAPYMPFKVLRFKTMDGTVLDMTDEEISKVPPGPEVAPEPAAKGMSVSEVQALGAAGFAAGEPRENGLNMKIITDRLSWMRGWDHAKADADAKAAGMVALPSEFPFHDVSHSYNGISHQGDSRARSDREEFMQTVQDLYTKAKAKAETPAQLEALDTAIGEFKTEYLNQVARLAGVRMSTYSGYVAGRANINTKQANRRNDALDKAQERFTQWLEGAKPNVMKAVQAARSPDQLAAADQARAAEQAIKDEKAAATRAKNDAFLAKLLDFKKGSEPVHFNGATLVRVSKGADGLPTSITLQGPDLIKGVNDKFAMVPILYKTKADLQAAVERVRAAPVAEPAAPATPQHEENGETEAAKPEVIAESLEKDAKRRGIDYTTAKDELLGKIDTALANLKAQWDPVNKLDGPEYIKAAKKLGEQLEKYVIFDIPGDGQFKVANQADKLEDFRKRAIASKGFNPPPKPRADRADKNMGVSSDMSATIRQMLEDGEAAAAYELAKVVGKPFRFSVNQKGGNPNVYTDVADVQGMPLGITGYVGRLYGHKGKNWVFIESNSGHMIGEFSSSAKDAEASARKKIKEAGDEKMQAALAKAKAAPIDADALEQEWLTAAEQADQEVADKATRADQLATAVRAADAQQADSPAGKRETAEGLANFVRQAAGTAVANMVHGDVARVFREARAAGMDLEQLRDFIAAARPSLVVAVNQAMSAEPEAAPAPKAPALQARDAKVAARNPDPVPTEGWEFAVGEKYVGSAEAAAKERNALGDGYEYQVHPDGITLERRKVAAAPAPVVASTGPMTVAEHASIMEAAREGKVTLEQLRAAYERTYEHSHALKTEMSKMLKAELLAMGGPMFTYRNKGEGKPAIIKLLYMDMLEDYTLGTTGGISYVIGGGSGTYESAKQKAIDKAMDALTPEHLQKFAADVAAARAERQEKRQAIAASLEDPKTLDDYVRVIRSKQEQGATFTEARLSLTPEQRAQYDELAGQHNRAARAERKTAAVEQRMRAPGEALTATETIKTRHTKHGHDLWQFQLEQRVDDAEFKDLVAKAKTLGGTYSSYRGNGAIPGWQFRTPEAAEAFRKLVAGDAAAAQELAQQRRDAFADDRSQSAVERLQEMADRLEDLANDSDSADRKTNTARRARFAAAAEATAASQRAMAETMRRIADGISNGTAKFLDKVRQKVQIELLGTLAAGARTAAADREFPLTADQYGRWTRPHGYGDRLQVPPTLADMDHAEWPSYTAFRSDLASLGRQLVNIDGTKKLGQQILKVADDVTAEYTKFAKDNLLQVGTFSTRSGERAVFANKEAAEKAIARSGYRGKAIVLAVKRGENVIVMSPSEAMARGIWKGDGDRKITLHPDLGDELVAKLGKINRRTQRVDLPWSFETAHYRRTVLQRMNIETPTELRAALREYMQLKVAPKQADRVKQLERDMIGRRKDGLDFFPTPATQADEMIEVAELEAGMRVLEPSAGMGHIADRIRAAGVEPDVVEMSGDRRELLEAKGYNLVGHDFMELTEAPRGYTFGDLMEAPDGTRGIVRGLGGMGSDRVRLVDQADPQRVLGYYNFSELEGVELLGVGSGYDRIIMNPPFSDRRDAAHVKHAYSLLKPGGRLVAIMGEGVFFGQDAKAEDFRNWLDALGGTSEKLAEGTFMDPSLPVNTGVNARMVVIDKPEGPAAQDGGQLRASVGADRRASDRATTERRKRTVEVEGVRRPIYDSNGRQLGAGFMEQLKFWNWMGDSKAVNEHGEPRAMFHGTAGDFSAFDPAKLGSSTNNKTAGAGFFFSASPEVAAEFSGQFMEGWPLRTAYKPGANVMPVYVSIKNPKRITAREFMRNYVTDRNDFVEFARQAQLEGHDGLMIEGDPVLGESMGGAEYGADAWVAFKPEQIKSVTGNAGNYDPDDASILAKAGDVMSGNVDRVLMVAAEFGATADKLLGYIERLSGNPEYKALARALRNLKLNTMVYKGQPRGTYTAGVQADQATASYRQYDDTAYLHQQAGAEQALLHELVHAATLAGLQAGGPAAEQIRQLWRHVKDRPNFAEEYGIVNEEEFIAEALTNPRFRQMLEDTPAPGVKLSLWQKLVGIVRMLLGNVAVSDNVLARVMAAAPDLMAENAAAKAELESDGRQGQLLGNDLRGAVHEFGSPALDRFNQVMAEAENWLQSNGKTASLTDMPPAMAIDTLDMVMGFGTAKFSEQAKAQGREIWTRAENAYRQLSRTGADTGAADTLRASIAGGPADFLQRLGVRKTLADRVGDFFASEKSFNGWWHKTVGTQYHKAEVDSDYRRVYDAVQRYLSSVSMLANEAADRAPTLLPKLENMADLKKAPPKREDVTKVSNAIFLGTLEDEKVYSDDELRTKFSMTAPQIALYREFRAAIDKSLDDMGKTDLLRTAGKTYAGLRNQVMGAGTAIEASRILARAAQDRGDMDLTNNLLEKGGKYAELKREGYAPLMRFGEHTVYVKGPAGEQLYFGLYESAADAAKAARDMREIYPDATVTKGIMSTEGSRLFAGINPDTINLYAQVTGLERDPLFQDYYKLVVNNRSALKRLIHRKGIAGYSEDGTRVLASFLTSNARAAAKNLHGGEMNEAAEAIPKNKGDVRDEAIKLVDYIQNPVEEAAKVRGLLFANFIGGSIASAMVNMTQPIMMTMPYLAQFAGAGKATKLLTAAMAQALKADSTIADAELRTALQVAERQGVVSPQEIHNLQAEAMRSSNGLTIGGKEVIPAFAARKLALVWGGFFGLAEQFNRKATFIAAYQAARDMTGAQLAAAKVATPYDFAVKAIAETQGVYNRGNRPNWARGAVGATLMTFKQYSVSYMEFLKRLPPQQRALALAILVVAAGANGLPFADDLDDLIETIAQALGYNWSAKKARERFVTNTLGQGAADFVLRGVSGVSGIPLDISMRMGMQNLLPATGIFLKQNTDKGAQLGEIAGAAGALAQRAFRAGEFALAGDVGKAASALSPTAIANLAKGIDMLQTGAYRDGRGRLVLPTDTLDAAVKMVGFQPAKIAREQDQLGMARDTIAVAKVVEAQIADAWARGVYEKDPQAAATAREAIAEWNRKNPESRITITMPQITKRVREMRTAKADRVVNTAPKAMRAGLREELDK